jgi:hypothetical protein
MHYSPLANAAQAFTAGPAAKMNISHVMRWLKGCSAAVMMRLHVMALRAVVG